ncbi:SIR2 family protein [Candidatus Poriferisodalis sp.]|uniref:SIR2 family protein n=1 Tax=Candidatus Poriferisodalis sp. TaxID=3101277 RepID=UPI003C6F3834
MRLEHAELPTGLVEAHKQGCLVLFVGAGVSLPAPSCIPLLDGLAHRVADELGLGGAPDVSSAPEEMFEELEGRGLGVHAAVRRIVGESPAPNDVHRAVDELAQAGPAIRIVTTNYDRHLAACLPQNVRVYEAPDLPGDEDFEGVVHLHGWVEQEPSRLVITRSDFAEAYMQPLSPTLAFLHRMFASSTVLFVGYSADDTLMQYVLRAARGRTDLLTLHPRPDDPKWKALDITPVGYGHHDNLPLLLSEWAQRAGTTRDQHVDWVTRIVTECESLDGLSDLDESYLADVI